jgi:hypothetical protein
MRLIRSFPATIPPGRAYVVDQMERFIMTDYDYSGLGALDDDVLLLEWDMAVSREDLTRFQTTIARYPDEPLVAPYRLYRAQGAVEPVWAHRLIDDTTGEEAWLWDGLPLADYIGFGMVYLPRMLIRAFLAAPAPARGRSPYLPPEAGYSDMRLTDQTFSIWLRHTQGVRTMVDWRVRPVHLHFDSEVAHG